jgi:hypothetical protein
MDDASTAILLSAGPPPHVHSIYDRVPIELMIIAR